MEKLVIQNPFVVGRYISPDYFCDREKETTFLIKQIENGRNVALISPRRMGKTGLIHHTFHQETLTQHFHTFFVDIYATTSLAEFVYLLGKAIYDELKPKSKLWRERFFQIITSLQMGFKWDALSGEPSFDISLGDIQAPQTTLDEIFEYLEAADMPCVVAIDEFQQVTSSAFIKKYNLPSASSVQSAIKGLLKNDIITQEDDAYRVYDYFFATWLAKDY